MEAVSQRGGVKDAKNIELVKRDQMKPKIARKLFFSIKLAKKKIFFFCGKM